MDKKARTTIQIAPSSISLATKSIDYYLNARQGRKAFIFSDLVGYNKPSGVLLTFSKSPIYCILVVFKCMMDVHTAFSNSIAISIRPC